MKHFRAIALVCTVALAGAPFPTAAQELQTVGSRQCAIEGTELYGLLNEQLPGCDLYCTVDNELVPGYETYPGLVFACADRRGALLPPDDDPAGFNSGAIAALLGAGLLLGLAGGGGGSTNNTQ